jgi:LAO/AO transport system kinase
MQNDFRTNIPSFQYSIIPVTHYSNRRIIFVFTTMAKKKIKPDSALHVQKGIDQPSQVNPALSGGMQKFKKIQITVDDLSRGILTGNRSYLSRAITLIESSRSDDQEIARQLVSQCLPHSGKSVRLGITGVPGAGKSTFIESFGIYLIEKGHKVAVLAIDPSSQRSKGSILGDKTRMENLSANPNAFIRPSATAGTLGGVARATREAVILCEAAGFDLIIIETVGVGQSETAVSGIVDFFLLLMLAGGGDELQGIKRGIMEMADLIVINKADGDNVKKAEMAKREYENALHLFPLLPSGWGPKVLTASAIYGSGLSEIWSVINEYMELTRGNGYFKNNRKEQSLHILQESIRQNLSSGFFNHPSIKGELKTIEQQILNEKLSPYQAAGQLLDKYFKAIKDSER